MQKELSAEQITKVSEIHVKQMNFILESLRGANNRPVLKNGLVRKLPVTCECHDDIEQHMEMVAEDEADYGEERSVITT